MEEEKKVEQENKKVYWKDVEITPDMPLSAIVQFLNILNSRLSGIEDVIVMQDDEGKDVSLSEIYAKQNEEGAK